MEDMLSEVTCKFNQRQTDSPAANVRRYSNLLTHENHRSPKRDQNSKSQMRLQRPNTSKPSIEVPRQKSQLEVSQKKARNSLLLSDQDHGDIGPYGNNSNSVRTRATRPHSAINLPESKRLS